MDKPTLPDDRLMQTIEMLEQCLKVACLAMGSVLPPELQFHVTLLVRLPDLHSINDTLMASTERDVSMLVERVRSLSIADPITHRVELRHGGPGHGDTVN